MNDKMFQNLLLHLEKNLLWGREYKRSKEVFYVINPNGEKVADFQCVDGKLILDCYHEDEPSVTGKTALKKLGWYYPTLDILDFRLSDL